MATAPRTAKCDPSVTVNWGGGVEFNGYVLIASILPQVSGSSTWPSLAFHNQIVLDKLPLRTKIPIIEGKYDQTSEVFYTADIDPPGVVYVAWLYDRNNRKVTPNPTIGTHGFTVASTYFTPVFASTNPSVPITGSALTSVEAGS